MTLNIIILTKSISFTGVWFENAYALLTLGMLRPVLRYRHGVTLPSPRSSASRSSSRAMHDSLRGSREPGVSRQLFPQHLSPNKANQAFPQREPVDRPTVYWPVAPSAQRASMCALLTFQSTPCVLGFTVNSLPGDAGRFGVCMASLRPSQTRPFRLRWRKY